MKVLLTGAGGFIGRNLLQYLTANGVEVITAASKEYDFTDAAAVAKLTAAARADAFILAGFYGIEDAQNIPGDTAQKNLIILKNFLAGAQGRPVFTFGSGAEYDKARPIIKAKESDADAAAPRDTYGRAKKLISQEVERHANACNLRLFGVFGPGEAQSRFITHAINCSLNKQPITIRQNVIFDYLYIKDLRRIMLAFIKAPPQARAINLTPTESIDLITIANLVNQISGQKSQIIVDKPGLANEYTGANALLRRQLPAFTFTPYKQSIAEFYAFLKERKV